MRFWCANEDLFVFFIKPQVVIVYPAAEKGVIRNAGVAASGGARKQGLFTDFREEVDKVAKEKTALRSSLAKIGV